MTTSEITTALGMLDAYDALALIALAIFTYCFLREVGRRR